jgi:hypothetical protein
MEAGAKKKLKRGCLALFIVALGLGIWFYGPLVRGLYNAGFLDRFLKSEDKRKYEGTSMDNLRYMQTALLGYHDSEGQFPVAAGWMDAIHNRLNTDDLKKGEEAKKLVYPGYVGQDGKYGYAFNDALSGKYKGDIKDPKTPLVFESTDTEKNAHGDPAKLRRPGGLAISVDGQILK